VSFLADTYLPASAKFSEKSNVLPAIQIFKKWCTCVMDPAGALADAACFYIEDVGAVGK
jgi:hypothetical protein